MDITIIGSAFYVMQFIKGRIFQSILMPSLSTTERRECWKSAIDTLTRLSTVPIELLDLPDSFAPKPKAKPYFPRQVTSLLRVSEAQAKARDKESGKEVGSIWGMKEMKGWFEDGAGEIGVWEGERGVGGVVHGDYKLDNLVGTVTSSPLPLPSSSLWSTKSGQGCLPRYQPHPSSLKPHSATISSRAQLAQRQLETAYGQASGGIRYPRRN